MAQLQMISLISREKIHTLNLVLFGKEDPEEERDNCDCLGAMSSGGLQMVLKPWESLGFPAETLLKKISQCLYLLWLLVGLFCLVFPWATERFDHSNKTRVGPALKEIRKIRGWGVDLPTASTGFCVVLPLAQSVGLAMICWTKNILGC